MYLSVSTIKCSNPFGQVKDPVNIGNPSVRQALWNLSEDVRFHASLAILVNNLEPMLFGWQRTIMSFGRRFDEDKRKTRAKTTGRKILENLTLYKYLKKEFARKMSRSERMKFLRDNLSCNKESKGDGGPSSGASQTGGLNVPGTGAIRRTSKQNLEDFFNKIASKNLPKWPKSAIYMIIFLFQ